MPPTCQYLTVLLEYLNCFLTPFMVSTQGETLQISMALAIRKSFPVKVIFSTYTTRSPAKFPVN